MAITRTHRNRRTGPLWPRAHRLAAAIPLFRGPDKQQMIRAFLITVRRALPEG